MTVGMAIGVLAELVARAFKLWIYRDAQTPVLNVFVVFGLIMGFIASRIRRLGIDGAFFVAFGIGLAYEIANFRLLKWWEFPGDRLGFIRGHTAIAVVIALLWGTVPVVIAATEPFLPGGRRRIAVTGQARLEALSEREQQLLHKLEELQQRERALQNQLEGIHTLKERLLSRQEARHPAQLAATPSPGT